MSWILLLLGSCGCCCCCWVVVGVAAGLSWVLLLLGCCGYCYCQVVVGVAAASGLLWVLPLGCGGYCCCWVVVGVVSGLLWVLLLGCCTCCWVVMGVAAAGLLWGSQLPWQPSEDSPQTGSVAGSAVSPVSRDGSQHCHVPAGSRESPGEAGPAGAPGDSHTGGRHSGEHSAAPPGVGIQLCCVRAGGLGPLSFPTRPPSVSESRLLVRPRPTLRLDPRCPFPDGSPFPDRPQAGDSQGSPSQGVPSPALPPGHKPSPPGTFSTLITGRLPCPFPTRLNSLGGGRALSRGRPWPRGPVGMVTWELGFAGHTSLVSTPTSHRHEWMGALSGSHSGTSGPTWWPWRVPWPCSCLGPSPP